MNKKEPKSAQRELWPAFSEGQGHTLSSDETPGKMLADLPSRGLSPDRRATNTSSSPAAQQLMTQVLTALAIHDGDSQLVRKMEQRSKERAK